MLKEFYQLKNNEQEEKFGKNAQDSYKLFAGGTVILDNKKIKALPALQIAKDKDIMVQQGTWPVIYIDLKDISGSSYEEVLQSLEICLNNCWSEHIYLLKSNKLDQKTKEIIQKFSRTKINKRIDKEDLIQGLYKLSEILHKYHGKKVKILIDEYDSVINKAYIDTYIDAKDISQIINLYRDFLSPALKSNDHLDKAILTGVFTLAKTNIFSGLNNIRSYGMWDIKFAKYYGFTQEDVEELLEIYNVDLEISELIQYWYNGCNSGKLKIYNPWSIINALYKYKAYNNGNKIKDQRNDVLRNYWGESGNVNFIISLLKHQNIKNKIETLASGGGIYFKAINELCAEDYIEFRNMIFPSHNYEITFKTIDILFSYLLAGGYLTYEKQSNLYYLFNQEVKDYIQNKLAEYYEHQFYIDLSNIKSVKDQIQLLFDAKISENYSFIEISLSNKLTNLFTQLAIFNRSKNIVDVKSGEYNIHVNEAVMQNLINYIALQLKKINQFATEIYLGNGRVDLFMEHSESRKIIILEVKNNKQGANLALEQIKEKQYIKPIPEGYALIKVNINVDYNENVNVKIDLINDYVKKEFYLNSVFKNNLVKACEILKIKALKNDIKDLKKITESFKDIFNGNISIETSYKNLEKNHIVPRFDFDIENAFYTLGLELRSPENGSTNILREAYENDVQNLDKSFIDYHCATIEETYRLVETQLIGNDDVSKQ